MKSDIISWEMKDNETWNTCPICGKDYKDSVATLGVIHRTKICDSCVNGGRNDEDKGRASSRC